MLPTGIAGFGDQLPACAPAPRYERHRPEQTLLYQIVDKHYPDFLAQLAAEDRFLPDYVQQDFTEFLKCGLLEHGFLRVRCESCHHEKLVAFSCKRRGLLRASCPPPFGPAFGSTKSLPAILSAPVAEPGAWPIAQPC